eukprot:TRINITY_DN3283_c0_g1_i3.p1 TRINITY_DN3283_c0_g1~~TRINITY_DN3283_c0_g1_i3.p1  ORF type:complete len:159 (+),score=42.89 TRINITY_DN3283_c0_g1_i3:166-642(+)
MQSLEDFAKEVNASDLKYDLMERWIARKEREIRGRIDMPPANYHKTDKMIKDERERKDAERRRKVLETLTRRKYEDITRSDLEKIVGKLCKRMCLFDGEYPQLIVDLVKELRQHPNITTTDKQVERVVKDRCWKHTQRCLISTGKKDLKVRWQKIQYI